MKITINSYNELKNVHKNLTQFLHAVAHKNIHFRMIIFEYNQLEKKSETLSIFDSNCEQINKQVLKNKKFCDFEEEDILDYFAVNKETAIIESNLANLKPDEKNKQVFFVIFSFEEEMNYLLGHFLVRYQKKILERFNKRTMIDSSTLLSSKQFIFDETIKQFVDLKMITALADSHYETSETLGSIIDIQNREGVKYKVKFAKEIDFNMNNLRLVRKLLEMSDSRLSLVIYDKKVVGLGTEIENTKKIQFGGRGKWTLFINQQEVLRHSRGELFFNHGYNEVVDGLPKGFIAKKYGKKFNDLIEMLMRQKSGSLLIISDEAQAEVLRLANLDRGYAIDPIDLSTIENMSLIKNISAVDGAMFIDRQLKCYGVGIILDGVAKRSGSTARGARYNSSCCYLDNKNEVPYVAVVFSEDETVDVLYNEAIIDQLLDKQIKMVEI